MTEQTTNELIKQAQTLLRAGDRKAAGILIRKIVENDFTNPTVWQFLHKTLGKDTPLETFKAQFIQKYYPEKAYLIMQKPENENSSYPAFEATDSSHSTKKCPYCAESIQFEARVCRFCGHDLTKEHPDIIHKKRRSLNTKLVTLERNIAKQEHALQEWQQVAQKEQRGATQSEIVFIVGVFLTPIGIGVILLIISGLAYFSHKSKRNNAEKRQKEIRLIIENLRKEMAKVKTGLANLE